MYALDFQLEHELALARQANSRQRIKLLICKSYKFFNCLNLEFQVFQNLADRKGMKSFFSYIRFLLRLLIVHV